ncbi:MAG: hypothetical protein LPK07_05875 [Hymenobacteraceae bacterium]|nr:hypothetical protein [Hymenobacteraceae bacterium]
MEKTGEDKEPALSYWHVWTDENGVSHQTKCELRHFNKESISEGAAPQWNKVLLQGAAANIRFAGLPVGWVGEWHENPEPQWIIPLSGRWFVETMDGQRVEMGPGDISFGGDQHTQEDEQGRKGHRSGTVGDEPAMLLLLQLTDKKWVAAKPGDFR